MIKTNTTKSGASSAHQRSASWWADDGSTLNAGLVALVFEEIRISIANEPYSIFKFQGEGVRTPSPPPPLCHSEILEQEI